MTGPRRLVVLAAGGTGGHVFPADALAQELGRRGCDLALVTDRRGGVYGGALGALDTYRIRAGGIAGKNLAARLKSALELAIGTWQARGLLRRLMPGAVIGFGGYASVPTMLAARFGGFPTLLHEQNAVLGRANRFLAGKVSRIATCFAEVIGVPDEASARVVQTGMPVRQSVRDLRDHPYPGIDGGEARLMVIGGSQGARVLSDVVPEAIAQVSADLRTRLRIVQQCRPEDLERVEARYRQLGVAVELSHFFEDVPDKLAEAHLIIGRCGASTVAELTAIGRPALLIPYPHAIDDHQAKNAHAMDEAGAGWLIPEKAFTPDTLASRLEDLFGLPATLEKAAVCSKAAGHPDAVERLADLVEAILPSNGADGDEGRAAA